MPIRIYALAKELDIDSKKLVEACVKLGIQGKGSALASLDDDETEKVRRFLSGGRRPGPVAEPTPPPRIEAPVRPAPPEPTEPAPAAVPETRPRARRRPLDILLGRKRGEQPPETPEEPQPLAPPEEEPSVAAAAVGDTEIETVPPPVSEPPEEPDELDRGEPVPAEEKSAATWAITRDDYVAPTGVSPIRVIGQKTPKGTAAPKKKPDKKTPVVRLAEIPKTPKGSKPEKKEPAAQKPVMTLSPDAIRGVKEGGKAPLEEYEQKHKQRQEAKARKKGAAAEPAAPEDAGTEERTARGDRKRRGKKEKGREPDTVVEEEMYEEGKPGKPTKGLVGMGNTRASRQESRKRRKQELVDESGEPETAQPAAQPRRRKTQLTRKGTNTAAPRKGKVVIEFPCTVRSFSEATGIPTSLIQRTLMSLGMMATITATIEPELAELLAVELGLELEFKQRETVENVLDEILDREDDPALLEPRAPIVTFLGHVDHGKTSLLDKIIGLNVVSGEAGGITQHIRAYEVNKGDRKVTFVDTPGHEAFTEMRARGANVTDIAVLVVAADDGIMPQTEEAISHAKAAEVPIVVALNKIDLPGVDPVRTMTGLTQHGLQPSEWGGEVEVVRTSATTGEGIDELLEVLLLTADLREYQANPSRPAIGTCLESEQEGQRGVVAKLVVRNGTLHVGDVVVCGEAHGRVKAMYDTLQPNKKLKQAGPSTPVNITGLDVAPGAGDRFYVLDDIAQAREIALNRQQQNRQQSLSQKVVRVSLDDFQRRLLEGRLGGEDGKVVLNLILRADMRGSIEAIQKEIGKLDHPEVEINFLQASVGAITLADVMLAEASDAVIIGFNVIPDEAARGQADERGVEIRRYSIIYNVTDDLRAMLEGRLKPEERVAELGRALVQQVFRVGKVSAIAGCRVLAGTIERGCRIRVNRDGRGIGDYPLESLRREKDDVRSVREGYECGMKLGGFNDLKEGDLLEAYKIEEVARTL